MKTATPWTDEAFLRGVQIVPDITPAFEPQQYETLVLLGPSPLKLSELFWGLVGVCMFLISATCVVGAIWAVSMLVERLVS